jgi:hypothetical protein
MKSLTIAIVVMVFLIGGQVVEAIELCGDETTEVNNGEYIVMNNIWGEGAGEQCINVSGTSFEVTYSTHTNGSQVKAYPVIYKGYHWGHGTVNPNLPMQVSKIEGASANISISGTNAGGTWNAAFESWYSTMGAGDPAGGCELMIWIYKAGGAGPGGSQVGTVTIGGNSWDVYYADWDWNYVAYICTSNITSATLDIKAFTNDAVSRGYINSSWYLDAMEFGFEIWADGQGLRCNSYSASATGEAMNIIPAEPPPASETPTTGVWYKVLNGNSGKAMEVADSSTSDGSNVQQWDYTGGQNQEWMLEETDASGYYRLTPGHATSMCLQVENWSTEDGGNLVLGTYADYQNNQQWSLEKEGDWYNIMNRNSGKLVDVQACSETNGGNLHQWSYYSDGAESQRWSFQSVDGGATQPPAATPVPTNPPTSAPTDVTSLGDVNNDGNINIVDALLVAQYYVGLNPSNFNTARADTNCDGSINIVDALLIAQYYVGLVNQFC